MLNSIKHLDQATNTLNFDILTKWFKSFPSDHTSTITKNWCSWYGTTFEFKTLYNGNWEHIYTLRAASFHLHYLKKREENEKLKPGGVMIKVDLTVAKVAGN